MLVGGALRRLSLYEQAYGLTILRLWAEMFAVWIGAAFVLLGVSLAGVGAARRWFVPAAGGLALAGLIAFTVANPEAIIARRNIDRFAGTDRLDVAALTSLSDDAVPTVLASLDRMRPDDADLVRINVCGRSAPTGGWAAANLARRRAAEARARWCLGHPAGRVGRVVDPDVT